MRRLRPQVAVQGGSRAPLPPARRPGAALRRGDAERSQGHGGGPLARAPREAELGGGSPPQQPRGKLRRRGALRRHHAPVLGPKLSGPEAAPGVPPRARAGGPGSGLASRPRRRPQLHALHPGLRHHRGPLRRLRPSHQGTHPGGPPAPSGVPAAQPGHSGGRDPCGRAGARGPALQERLLRGAGRRGPHHQRGSGLPRLPGLHPLSAWRWRAEAAASGRAAAAVRGGAAPARAAALGCASLRPPADHGRVRAPGLTPRAVGPQRPGTRVSSAC
mmetsp:Transcript_40819/g.128480  ORF Transcript_40819/g.128480 Transcript_40819/m.128480 type:complete len:274 (-) Transcript_40819:5-826(-)